MSDDKCQKCGKKIVDGAVKCALGRHCWVGQQEEVESAAPIAGVERVVWATASIPCVVHNFSSRMCQFGTKSCIVDHDAAAPIPPQAAQVQAHGQDERDAARYRWLRSAPICIAWPNFPRNAALDAAVDAWKGGAHGSA